MQLIIEVPDNSQLASDINAWADGSKYELGVTQTATGEFTLDTAEPAETNAEENNEGDEPAPDAKYKNPAMAKMMASRATPK